MLKPFIVLESDIVSTLILCMDQLAFERFPAYLLGSGKLLLFFTKVNAQNTCSNLSFGTTYLQHIDQLAIFSTHSIPNYTCSQVLSRVLRIQTHIIAFPWHLVLFLLSLVEEQIFQHVRSRSRMAQKRLHFTIKAPRIADFNKSKNLS